MRRRQLTKWLKTVPGIAGAAIVTALVGALIAYFVPKWLDDATGHNGIKVSVETNPAEIDTFNDLGQAVIVPNGETIDGSPGAGCGGFADWSKRVGAVRAGRTDIRLIVQGVGDQIAITGFRADVTERREPLSGTGVRCPSAGAGPVRSVVIDLDEPDPTGEVKGSEDGSLYFKVGPNETEVFDVTAWTTECYCKWRLELVTTQDGEQKVVTVTDDGADFETTAWSPNPIDEFPEVSGRYYSWNWDSETWSALSDYETEGEYQAGETLPALPTIGPASH